MADPAPRTAPGTATTRASVPAFAAAGALAGLGAGLLDAAVVSQAQGGLVGAEALPYALAVDTLMGAALGLGAGVLLFAGGMLRRLGRHLSLLPLALAAVAAFLALNATLFDGPSIRQHPQLTLIKAAFYVLGSLAVAGAVVLFPLLLRRGRIIRWGLGAAGLAAAAGGAWAGLHKLNAYPMIKVQFALGTWMALGCSLALLAGRRTPRPARATALTLVLAAAALGTGALARGSEDIHRLRSHIIDTPYPATLRAIRPVEAALLAPLFPLPEFLTPPDLVHVVGEEGSARAAAQTELDRLVPGRRGMNVVWIAIDALRADHVSCHGYGRPTTPRIDALAREGAWFTRATTPTPASALAYSSTLCGVFGRVSPAYEAQHSTDLGLKEGLPLPSVLKRAGFRTYGLTGFHTATQALPVFATHKEGFDVFNRGRKPAPPPADAITGQALELVDEAAAHERPFFLWVHYFDPHAPYEPVPGHDFGPGPIGAYDSEIAFTDHQVGRLLDGLAERGLTGETILVLFADHGEGFGEHNDYQHGGSLYSHQLEVPLVIRVPGLPPRKVRKWVGLSDLVPTTLALLGIRDPFQRLGRDLTPLMLGRDEEWVDSVYAERPAPPDSSPRSKARCVCSGELKLIWKPHHHTVQVFDLSRDPREEENLFDRSDPRHQRLLGLLKGWDRRIDGYIGAAGSDGGRTLSLEEIFSRKVDALVEATDPGNRLAALEGVKEILESPAISRLAVNMPLLGERSLSRTEGHLAALLPQLDPGSESRVLAVEILGLLDTPGVVGLFAEEMERPTSPWLTLKMAVVRARHGDRRVLEDLQEWFPAAPVPERMFIAEALAYLGDDRGRDLLHAMLNTRWDLAILAGIRGLGALEDPRPIHAFLFCEEPHWKRRPVIDAMLETALSRDGPLGHAALLRIAGNGGPQAARAARQALKERLPPEVVARIPAVSDTLAGAREAANYRRYDLVLSTLETLSPADDPLMGPSWWLQAQAAWEQGRGEILDRALVRLEAAACGDPQIARLCRRIARHRDGPPRPPPGKLDLAVRPVGDPVIDHLRCGRLFYVRVAVTNRSGSFISGGWWRDGPQLGIWYDNRERGPLSTAVLPPEGLEPGETVELILIGRWPDEPGPCSPRVVRVPRPGSSPRAIYDPLGTWTLE